jgi:sulfate adenylyltransferase
MFKITLFYLEDYIKMTEPKLVLDKRTLCDLECILNGAFDPLGTFMTERDWKSVCKTMKMQDGTFFPLPVTLHVSADEWQAQKLEDGKVVLLCTDTNLPIAKLTITEHYQADIGFECVHAYGTNSPRHPYVKYKKSLKLGYYLSGSLVKIQDVQHEDFKSLRMSPQEMREFILENGWETVVGFQTRNPMHRSHYELTRYAMRQTHRDDAKLLIHPVVGVTQECDVDYTTRVKCYEAALENYEPNTAKLALLQLSMRMAGPREACLHALVRKNHGCTHFIVGRDHAGPSSKKEDGRPFYGPYNAQLLLKEYAKTLGIVPIFSKNIMYNENDGKYYPENELPRGASTRSLSGTQLRKMLDDGDKIPEWFSFPKVAYILKQSRRRKGICFYFVGLPCSGKSTHALQLEAQIRQGTNKQVTLLDGDQVRNNLSKGLGFSREDRSTNVRRIGWVASEIAKHGGVVVCANIAPYEDDRQYNRELVESKGGRYVEIFVNTHIDECKKRDVKGLYAKAERNEIPAFTGVSDPFEIPSKSDVVVNNNKLDTEKLLEMIS